MTTKRKGWSNDSNRHSIARYGAFSLKYEIVNSSNIINDSKKRLDARYNMAYYPTDLYFWLRGMYNKDKKWLNDLQTKQLAHDIMYEIQKYIKALNRYHTKSNEPVLDSYLVEAHNEYIEMPDHEKRTVIPKLLLSLYKYSAKSSKRPDSFFKRVIVDAYMYANNNRVPSQEFNDDLNKVISDKMTIDEFIKKHNINIPNTFTARLL